MLGFIAYSIATLLLFTQSTSAHPSAVQHQSHLQTRALGFPYGQQKVRGVNIGGWLVLEPWITPRLFDPLPASIKDEWTFCANQDRGVATRALKAHWDTFITADDFRQIAAAGLNHVRIPIGFWAFDVSGGEPYIQGQKDYLYKAIGWARQYGIKVMIDLHGAPGSQNGFDNSGRYGAADWANSQRNLDRTKSVLLNLAKEFSASQYSGVVTALQILNEPAGFLNNKLRDTAKSFTNDLYYTIRYPFAQDGNGAQSDLLVVYHDAFQPPSFWSNFLTYPNARDVAADLHHYEIFSDAENRRSNSEHLSSICSWGSSNQKAFYHWAIVGEWTPATTDCAKYLNSRGLGSRYDGSYPGSSRIGDCRPFTGDGSTFSQEYKNFLRRSWDTNTQTYERNGQGWIQWTWKAPNAVEWSYQAGLAGGWIPRDPSQHLGYFCN